MLGKHVGEELPNCKWVGIPFAGAMSELIHIPARTVLVNDLHRHVINLARVLADDHLRSPLLKKLTRLSFHPDEIAAAKEACKAAEPGDEPDIDLAQAFFVSSWMGRANMCGTNDEFTGRVSIRWNASGGDSSVRYRSAIRSMVEFSRVMRRCTFETMDAIDFLTRCEDAEGHGIYGDPPFPGVGLRYKHNPGADETGWHRRLAAAVSRFTFTRVVMRFYDHPLIRELYPESRWTWRMLKGRDQANNGDKPEVLLINGPSFMQTAGQLF